jgi:hypothetical protein
MGEGRRTFSLSRLNNDTPFGIYIQDRMTAFRFGIEVITVSCRSMSLENGSHEFRNRTEHVWEFFFVCVYKTLAIVWSSIPEFERGFPTPEWLQYLITFPPTSGSHCMTLSFALTHLTTAHHFVTGISSVLLNQSPNWHESRNKSMSEWRRIVRGTGKRNRLIWTVCLPVTSWATGKGMFMKFSIASCYCAKKVSWTFASKEYYFILALMYVQLV